MKFKTSLLSLAFCVAASTATAADAPKLKDGVDAEVKAAVEAAQTAQKAAKEAHLEWFWAKPAYKLWEGSKQTNGKILDQIIELANAGKNEEAIKAAKFIENAAKQGLKQAELGPKAGPALYGM